MSTSSTRGLASIIVPCWNQLEFTQQCIAALKNHTRPPWELIVIDNGSTDGTSIYLAGVRDMAAVPVTVVTNATNHGFPAAINQGLSLARGEYLVLLNNDVVVTEDWLDQLVALVNARPRGGDAGPANGEVAGSAGNGIGLVGPMSNYVTPPQLVESLAYRDMSEMPGFARRWREEHLGQWFTVPRLSGFCLLMKRVVYDRIGGLDERFGIGFFDDDDLAERARRAGFTLAVAHDLFVHHYGSRTFAGNGVDTAELLKENAGRFAAKWGLNGADFQRVPVALRPWQGRDSVDAAVDQASGAPPPPHASSTAGRVRVAWEGDFEVLHSLAIVNRAVCRGLIDRGHDLELIAHPSGPTVEPDERVALDATLRQALRAEGDGAVGNSAASRFGAQVHVRHRWPPVMARPARGKWVLMQPWEFGSLPKSWRPMLRGVDEIWAYSRSVRACYIEAEVAPDRVHIVPLGVDPDVFRPGVEPLALASGPQIRLLFVGGTIHRKGIDLLLTAFTRAFRPADGVGLVIKEMGARGGYRGQTAQAEVMAIQEQGHAIEYIDRTLSEAEMAGLYAACDVLVHPFRGEGFGLPVVEAMACGLPVIVTGAGPALDYATDETAYLIPAERRYFAKCRVGEFETLGRPWQWEPDVDALVELLKRVVSDRTAARAVGLAASARIREQFTWAHTVDAVERRLLALAGLHDADRGVPARSPGRGTKVSVGRIDNPSYQTGTDVGVGRIDNPSYESGTDLGVGRIGNPSYQTGLGLGVGRIGNPSYESGTGLGVGRIGNPSYPSAGRRAASHDRPKVSLTMIVRDEEDNLPHCLASVRGAFDEIVVVDTGSTDRTVEIACEFGAKVFNFAWIDDFAAARNEALAHATGDYAFWLDADDVVEPPQRVKLEALLRGLRAGDHAAYVVRCACDPSPDGTGGDTVVDHIRLFPLGPGVRWTYRVHEQILPSLKRAKVPVRWTDLTVRHTGYVDKSLRARKLERDTKILRRELEDQPDEPFVLFNLGAIAVERQEWPEALACLERSLRLSAPTDSIVRKLYALIARVHQMTGDSQGALTTCADGLKLDPDDAELWFRKAVLHRHRGESAEAERCWRFILNLKRPDQFCSFDQGIYGHLTRRNLAVLAAERGDHAEVRQLWTEVLAECPGDRDALARLERLTTARASGEQGPRPR